MPEPGRHNLVENWQIAKPVVRSRRGVVSAQNYLAARAGAAVLADGGNAIDAAVATGMCLGVVEPWMSGLGGGGFMQIYLAAEDRCHTIDFGMRASCALDTAAYPLNPDAPVDDDLFGWPAVVEDRNVHGPCSIAVPGVVAGHALAVQQFGTWSWFDLLTPAVDAARRGLLADWYATLKIASEARVLREYPESVRRFLPDGLPPAGSWAGSVPVLDYPPLHETMTRLREAGPDDFYRGEIARSIAADAAELGAFLTSDDLRDYSARIVAPDTREHAGHTVHAAAGLTAGPTLQRTLELIEADTSLSATGRYDAGWCMRVTQSLKQAYAERLDGMGDVETSAPTCTTHFSVADAEGNLVAVTQTLLSVFGSKVTFPRTGILMNNGIMWFDPRPGNANSMAPGKRPLCNMCPTIVTRTDGPRYALGASGGRRIMPAVLQLVLFLTDLGMDLETAAHHPRIDVSGGDEVTIDSRFDSDVIAAIGKSHAATVAPNAVHPALYACPNIAGFDPRLNEACGASYIPSPWAASIAAL